MRSSETLINGQLGKFQLQDNLGCTWAVRMGNGLLSPVVQGDILLIVNIQYNTLQYIFFCNICCQNFDENILAQEFTNLDVII